MRRLPFVVIRSIAGQRRIGEANLAPRCGR